MLQNLQLKHTYSTKNSNLVKDFYSPVLECAQEYDRITGYYSPKVFSIASRGFAKMVHKNGKIRILTSVQVDEETYRALQESSDALRGTLTERILPSLNLSELQTQLEKDYYDIFVYLLHKGTIELKVVATLDNTGIFHQKIGIVRDSHGGAISFSGSNNETVYGWTKNIEQFKVFSNWQASTLAYFEDDVRSFDSLWNGEDPSAIILTVDEALSQKKFSVSQPDLDINVIVDRLESDTDNSHVEIASKTPTDKDDLKLRPYQLEAINSWISNSHRGIFEMATGTGKTFTGLAAVKSLYESQGKLFCVVAVPLRHLISQWMEDIEQYFPDARIVKVGGDYPTWRDELPRQARNFNKHRVNQVIVVTTYASFGSDDFSKALEAYDNDYCIIADEVHNAGTDRLLATLGLFTYRLGLSATPRNKWTDIDKDALIKTFDKITYSYPLALAIKNKVLVDYDYKPIPLYLNEDEAERYIELSAKISMMMHYDEDSRNNEMLTAVLSQRSAITKNAEEKNDTLRNLMSGLYTIGLHKQMLLYCDNQSQIAEAQNILRELQISSCKVTFKETLSERKHILADFAGGFVDALVARKCLDEGVNIPSTRTAVLMASNTDSREYIQRLGRVLRTYPGKVKSHIYDFIVLPPSEGDTTKYGHLLRSELERFEFFSENALNSESTKVLYDELMKRYNITKKEEV